MVEVRSRFIPRLESARGIAALTVAVYHSIVPIDGRWLHVPSIWELETKRQVLAKLAMIPFNGAAAVSFFFVLSGFVLGRSLATKNQLTLREAGLFAVSRVLRIYPVIAASIVVFALAYYFAHSFLPNLRVFGLADVARNLALMDDTFEINSPLWSAALELMATPLIFTAALAHRFGSRPAFALFAVTVAMLILLPQHFKSFYLIWISRYSFMFVLGVGLANLSDLRPSPKATKLLLSLAIGGLLVPRIWFKYDAALTLLLEATSSAVLIALLAAAPQSFASFLLNPSFRWLGRISYSFYGFHLLAIALLLNTLDTFFPSYDPFIATACIAMASIPISLGLATISHRFVEVPGITLGRRLTRAYSVDPGLSKGSDRPVISAVAQGRSPQD